MNNNNDIEFGLKVRQRKDDGGVGCGAVSCPRAFPKIIFVIDFKAEIKVFCLYRVEIL